jgi:hypothetical protein
MRWFRSPLSLVVVFALAGGGKVRAEPDIHLRTAGLGSYFLLSTEVGRNELKLTARQREQVREFQRELEEIAFELGRKHVALPKEKQENHALWLAVQDAATRQVLPRMSEMLTPEQHTRLEQIRLQAGGLVVFRIGKEKLGLSDEQSQAIRAAVKEFSEATKPSLDLVFNPNRSAEEHAAAQREYLEHYWSAQRNMVDIAVGQLNDDQHRRLDGLLGARLDPRTLHEQMEQAALTVVRPQLTVQIYDNGSIGIYQSNGIVTPVRR